jgi:hypothetical protein
LRRANLERRVVVESANAGRVLQARAPVEETPAGKPDEIR